jgi:hypothetical protein
LREEKRKELYMLFNIKIKGKHLKIILLFGLVINIIILLFIDGPWWGFFCLPLWFLIVSFCFLFLKNFILKHIKITLKNVKIDRYFKLILLIFLFMFTVYLGYFFFMIPMSYIRGEMNKPELERIASDLVIDTENDYEKTIAVLEWFDEDKKNIYNDYHLYEKDIKGFHPYIVSHFEIFGEEPYIGIRNFLDSSSLWILTSKFGWCGEFALLFRDIADACGLTVRKVVCNGEDHVWNEVLINGSWVRVDATKHHPQNIGFNLSKYFMERKVGTDIPGVRYGDVSYVYAEWLNGTRVDVTYRYTNLTNISLKVIDEEGNPISNIPVKLYSHNRVKKLYTGLSKNTNSTGECLFTIGGGDYSFKVVGGFFSILKGENRSKFPENDSYHEFEVIVKNDWFDKIIIVVMICLTIFIIFFYRYLFDKKRFKF